MKTIHSKVKIEIFVTRSSSKFRAKIKEHDNPAYEVTIGGKSWSEGKGRQYSQMIFERCYAKIAELKKQLNDTDFRDTFKVTSRDFKDIH